MDITPLIRAGQPVIQAYSADGFRVSGVSYKGAVLITPDHCMNWAVAETADKMAEDGLLKAIEQAAYKPDVILLGTGTSLVLPPAWVRTARARIGAPVEVMDTAAACRTFNLLLTEARLVLACLYPV